MIQKKLLQIQALDELRREVETYKSDAGWLGDYIDRGNPGDQERQTALENIARSREMAIESKARLLALMETLGESDPGVVKGWAATHQAVCR
jgi:hypothetical protein